MPGGGRADPPGFLRLNFAHLTAGTPVPTYPAIGTDNAREGHP
jgi:hypothetical protein